MSDISDSCEAAAKARREELERKVKIAGQAHLLQTTRVYFDSQATRQEIRPYIKTMLAIDPDATEEERKSKTQPAYVGPAPETWQCYFP